MAEAAQRLGVPGNFRAGAVRGSGHQEKSPRGEQYTGQFRQGQYHGEGRLTLPTGAKYSGQFVEGEFHGVGRLVHADGRQEEGTFKHGKLHVGTISQAAESQ